LPEGELRRLGGPLYCEHGNEYFTCGAVAEVRMGRGRLTAAVERTHSHSVQIWV
jgi:hypothetical protein